MRELAAAIRELAQAIQDLLAHLDDTENEQRNTALRAGMWRDQWERR